MQGLSSIQKVTVVLRSALNPRPANAWKLEGVAKPASYFISFVAMLPQLTSTLILTRSWRCINNLLTYLITYLLTGLYQDQGIACSRHIHNCKICQLTRQWTETVGLQQRQKHQRCRKRLISKRIHMKITDIHVDNISFYLSCVIFYVVDIWRCCYCGWFFILYFILKLKHQALLWQKSLIYQTSLQHLLQN